MKRIAILTAGGDTPALNATLYGAVTRANQRGIEVLGLMRGFHSLFDQRVPHVVLNPLYSHIPELDPTRGGTILGASRHYVDPSKKDEIRLVCSQLGRLQVDGLICIGGDGTMNGLQPLCDFLPTVLAPKTIDNDLGLNYPNEPDKWLRVDDPTAPSGYRYTQIEGSASHSPQSFQLDQMVNYATPGFATAVFVVASGVKRVRTSAESHRRIAIIEVMGRDSGFLSLGSAYGQPDIILVPEAPLDIDGLVNRITELYRLQGNVVIVCGEGIVGPDGKQLGASKKTTDPAGNVLLAGASEHLRSMLIEALDDSLFADGPGSSSRAIFIRKVGHTQRGGRPVLFDRFYAAQLGGQAVDMLLHGENNAVATLSWDRTRGFHVNSISGNVLRDRWGVIHARELHPTFYDPIRMTAAPMAVEYLLPIFTDAIGSDDLEHQRETLFDAGNLFRPYHSVVTDVEKRVQYL